MAERPKIVPSRLAETLVSDPAHPPDLTIFWGFLGRSSTEGFWRLYVTPVLDEYVEIADADIRYTRDLPDESGTIVWVATGAKLRHTRVHDASHQEPAAHRAGSLAERLALTGPIAYEGLGDAGPTGPPGQARPWGLPEPRPVLGFLTESIRPCWTNCRWCPSASP